MTLKFDGNKALVFIFVLVPLFNMIAVKYFNTLVKDAGTIKLISSVALTVKTFYFFGSWILLIALGRLSNYLPDVITNQTLKWLLY